ncbi:MAG: class I SAM-dependent methyltransferase [Chloroflexota bacterium]
MNLDQIARHYDLLYGLTDDDIPMWETLLDGIETPILEIGCGTGRLLLPLSEAGYHLTGLDLSEVALAVAQHKLQASGLDQQSTVHQADMRHFDLPDKNFNTAFIPLNTFMHCLTIDDQLSTLQTINNHLAPKGELIIDLFHPDPTLWAEADGRLYFEDELVDPKTGHTVQWYWRHDIDLENQMRRLTYILDEIDEEGFVRRTQIPVDLRFFYRYEVELLLRMSGFTLQAIYGSYDLEPFQGDSPRMIFLAQKE